MNTDAQNIVNPIPQYRLYSRETGDILAEASEPLYLVLTAKRLYPGTSWGIVTVEDGDDQELRESV